MMVQPSIESTLKLSLHLEYL